MQNSNENLKQNQVYTSIVVLGDGETWSGEGTILYLTESGWRRLLADGEIRSLDANDIVKRSAI